MGCYIFRSSINISEMLKETTLHESRICCEDSVGGVCLTIEIKERNWLVSQQGDWHGKDMLAALVKLQRWFRWFPQNYKDQIQRRTAVAMCIHKRLGKEASLGSIGKDLLELVAQLVFKKQF